MTGLKRNNVVKINNLKSVTPPVLAFAVVVVCLTILYGGNSLAGDSSVPTDFTTIQAAIDDAGTVAGDTINVLAGTQDEFNIHITKSVTIAGTGIGSTIIDHAGGIGFFVDADDVAIRDMTIKNFSQAIRFEKAGGTIDNTTLERVSMEDNSSRGIEIHNNTTVTNLFVHDCNFENTNK